MIFSMYKTKTGIYMGFLLANVPYNNRQPRKFLWLIKITYIHTSMYIQVYFQVCINYRQAEVCH